MKDDILGENRGGRLQKLLHFKGDIEFLNLKHCHRA